jgi:cell division protein ZapA
MKRSLCGQMDLYGAGWGDQQTGAHTVPNGANDVNGASHKRRGMLRPYKRAGPAACQARKFCVIFSHRRNMSAPVKVQIFGQVYSIQGELDGKYVQKLAKFVDEKMHEIADVTKTVDTQKVAVLAALAIADELHSMQRDRGDHEQLMREQAERCLTLVERALKQTA